MSSVSNNTAMGMNFSTAATQNYVQPETDVQILQKAGEQVWGAAGLRAYDIYSGQTSFLLGKVLTIVDASFSDKEQRKAVKDLVRQQFREQEKWVYSICTGGNMICATGEEMKPT
jgi:hypothetical protein